MQINSIKEISQNNINNIAGGCCCTKENCLDYCATVGLLTTIISIVIPLALFGANLEMAIRRNKSLKCQLNNIKQEIESINNKTINQPITSDNITCGKK